jgi:hypothetical protein
LSTTGNELAKDTSSVVPLVGSGWGQLIPA